MSEMMFRYRHVSFISIGHGYDHMTSIVWARAKRFLPISRPN